MTQSSGVTRGRIAAVLDRLEPAVVSSRRYHHGAAIRPALIALFAASMLIWADVDALGRWIMVGLLLFFGGIAGRHLWRARRAAADAPVAVRLEGLPRAQQPAAYRRLLLLCAIGMPALSAWIAWDLHRLETGQASSVYIWGPVAAVYGIFGFWPAVLALPTLCVWLLVAGRKRLRQLEAAAAE